MTSVMALLCMFIPAGERAGRGTLLAASAVTVMAFAGCGGDEGRPGNPAVYERINSLTICEYVQDEFDTAMDNAEARQPGDPLRDASLGYAKAADARLDDLGCYD